MRAIHGLIFDLDGVLTDTAEFHYQSWQRLADEEGVPFTRQDNERLRGVTRRESLLRLLKGRTLAEEQMQDWMHRKNVYYHELLQNLTPAGRLPGVTQLLQDARAAGIKLGVGSASRNVRPVLERLQLVDWFDAIGDATAVVNGKPAPDMFVWVAGGMGVRVAECVVFEDAEDGIEAARAAGCIVVGLGGDRVKDAHIQLPGLDGFRLSDLRAQLAALDR